MALQGKNEILKRELSMKDQQIARLSSKMVAVRQIVSPDSADNAINPINTTTMPIIVKVESVESDASDTTHLRSQNWDNSATVVLPVNACYECDKKFTSASGLKRHMVLHAAPAIPCPQCPLKFARTDYIQKHFKRAHEDGLSRSCRMKTGS